MSGRTFNLEMVIKAEDVYHVALEDLQRLMTAQGEMWMRANKVDRWRVENNDWHRAGGDCTCEKCEFVYYDHPRVRGFGWLVRLCNGDLVKL